MYGTNIESIMSTSELLNTTSQTSLSEPADEFQYRALSTGAIIAAIFGVLSLLIFFTAANSLESSLLLSPIPVIGLVVGIRALINIRNTPEQLSGTNFARVGIFLASISLVGGLSYAGFVRATEVPDGYTRTSFYEFRPGEAEQRAGDPIPQEVQALDGSKVFIKGYMRPPSIRKNVRQFLLVRDSNECCFGDLESVKFYDQVRVRFIDGLTTDYSRHLFRIGGTLNIHPENLARGAEYPVYTLEADYVK